jgi:hypothetical protein
MNRLTLILGALAVAPQLLWAQEEHAGYAAHQHRDIKALGADETAALLAGEGSGMALPAELNGYAGPRHVLDLRVELDLTPKQQRRIQQVFDSMQARAQELGRQVVDLEGRLDSHFAAGGAAVDTVAGLAADIGSLRGQLRAVHLVAHISTAAVLSHIQRQRYNELRGYTSGGR